MGRRFKDVSIGQLEELMIKLNEKMKAGCSIDDALMYVHCYAAVEELKDIKIKGPLFNWTDIEASTPPEDRGILCIDSDGDIWMAHYSKILKDWYADGYGNRIRDVVAWMEVPDYKMEKGMTKEEIALIEHLKIMPNKNAAVILLESVIQVTGPVSNKAGDEIRKILEELPI